MEYFISMAEALLPKWFFLKDFIKPFHGLFVFICGIDQSEWNRDLFGVGNFKEGGVDDGGGFEKLVPLDDLLASPAKPIDTLPSTLAPRS